MSNQYIQDSPQEYGELIAELKQEITTRLRNLLTAMLNDADDKLLDMADKAAYSHERDVFYMLKKKQRKRGRLMNWLFILKSFVSLPASNLAILTVCKLLMV